MTTFPDQNSCTIIEDGGAEAPFTCLPALKGTNPFCNANIVQSSMGAAWGSCQVYYYTGVWAQSAWQNWYENNYPHWYACGGAGSSWAGGGSSGGGGALVSYTGPETGFASGGGGGGAYGGVYDITVSSGSTQEFIVGAGGKGDIDGGYVGVGQNGIKGGDTVLTLNGVTYIAGGGQGGTVGSGSLTTYNAGVGGAGGTLGGSLTATSGAAGTAGGSGSMTRGSTRLKFLGTWTNTNVYHYSASVGGYGGKSGIPDSVNLGGCGGNSKETFVFGGIEQICTNDGSPNGTSGIYVPPYDIEGRDYGSAGQGGGGAGSSLDGLNLGLGAPGVNGYIVVFWQ